jgi:hypothetical protein
MDIYNLGGKVAESQIYLRESGEYGKEIVNVKVTDNISKQILSEYHEGIANPNRTAPQIVGRILYLYYRSPKLGRNVF